MKLNVRTLYNTNINDKYSSKNCLRYTNFHTDHVGKLMKKFTKVTTYNPLNITSHAQTYTPSCFLLF